jgi:hypothetical protein
VLGLLLVVTQAHFMPLSRLILIQVHRQTAIVAPLLDGTGFNNLISNVIFFIHRINTTPAPLPAEFDLMSWSLLVQHAVAVEESEDQARPISEAGRGDAQKMAEHLSSSLTVNPAGRLHEN